MSVTALFDGGSVATADSLIAQLLRHSGRGPQHTGRLPKQHGGVRYNDGATQACCWVAGSVVVQQGLAQFNCGIWRPMCRTTRRGVTGLPAVWGHAGRASLYACAS